VAEDEAGAEAGDEHREQRHRAGEEPALKIDGAYPAANGPNTSVQINPVLAQLPRILLPIAMRSADTASGESRRSRRIAQ